MKKIIALLLVAAMCLSLAACGGTKEEPTPEEEKTLLLSTEILDEITANIEGTNDAMNISYEELIYIPSLVRTENTVKNNGYDVGDCEITSHEQKDDYTYIVYGKAYCSDNFGDTHIMKFTIEYTAEVPQKESTTGSEADSTGEDKEYVICRDVVEYIESN